MNETCLIVGLISALFAIGILIISRREKVLLNKIIEELQRIEKK